MIFILKKDNIINTTTSTFAIRTIFAFIKHYTFHPLRVIIRHEYIKRMAVKYYELSFQ